MELRQCARILRRRWWLLAGLLLVVLVSGIVWRTQPAPRYTTSMRFVVGLEPEPSTGSYYTYDRYYTWLTAEYLLDDLAEVVKSHAFAQDVSAASGLEVPAGAIQGATAAGKLHRILTMQISWGDAAQLQIIADAAAQVLLHQSDKYFAQLSTPSAVISMIDPPQVSPVGRSLRERLDLPLRLVLALIAGIGLAFLCDYWDTSLRGRDEVQALGLSVLGEIPSRRPWWLFWNPPTR